MNGKKIKEMWKAEKVEINNSEYTHKKMKRCDCPINVGYAIYLYVFVCVRMFVYVGEYMHALLLVRV